MERKLTSYLDIEGYPCGHQLWWGKDTYGHHFGCGVIGGLDGLIHQGVVSESKLGRLAYMALADGLWADMRPNTGLFYKSPRTPYTGRKGIGVYSLNHFKKGLSKFAKRYGYDLNFETCMNMSWRRWHGHRDNIALAIAFIDQSLKKNQQVHLLSWRDKGSPYQFHWVTIVAIKDQGANIEVTIMTWGKKVIIKDFRDFWLTSGVINRKAMVSYGVIPTL